MSRDGKCERTAGVNERVLQQNRMAVARQLANRLVGVIKAEGKFVGARENRAGFRRIRVNRNQHFRHGRRGMDRRDRRRGNFWERGRPRPRVCGLVPKEPRAAQAQQAQQNPDERTRTHNNWSNDYLTKSWSKRGGISEVGDGWLR